MPFRYDDSRRGRESSSSGGEHTGWTFLSNHAHVLICLARDPHMTLREVSLEVGITERSVQRIVTDLEHGGYLRRIREGVRNHYELNVDEPLRHPLERHRHIGDLIEMVLEGS